MRLPDFNTVLKLNTHLERYLNSAVNYDALRRHLLANAPLSNIVSEIHGELDALASADKKKAKFDLTEQAQQQQIDEDREQARLDTRAKSSNIDAIAQLTAQIAQIDSEERSNNVILATHEAELSQLSMRLNHTRREISKLITQIQGAHRIESPDAVVTGHSIPHPSEARGGIHLPQRGGHVHISASSDSVHPAPHQYDNHFGRVELKLGALRTTEKELQSLVLGLSFHVDKARRTTQRLQRSRQEHESTLQLTRQAQQDIEMRDSEREQRRQVSATSPGDLAALSSLSRARLQSSIIRTNMDTDQSCRELKQAVSEQCYGAFLNQLEIHLDGIVTLQPNEKSALKRIIACMRNYLDERSNLERQIIVLRNLESELHALTGEHFASRTSASELQATNSNLEATNTTLTSQISTLKQQKEEFVMQRNQYALYTLVGSLLSGAAAVTYFLTQASIITLPPLALIIAASITVAALLVTFVVASVAGIRGYFRQSQIGSISNSIEQNIQQITRNSTTIRSLQESLPEYQGQIEAKELQIARQRENTRAVEGKIDALLRSANEVSVSVEADPSARAGVNFSQFQIQTFFGDASEAPPPYEQVVQVVSDSLAKIS